MISNFNKIRMMSDKELLIFLRILKKNNQAIGMLKKEAF